MDVWRAIDASQLEKELDIFVPADMMNCVALSRLPSKASPVRCRQMRQQRFPAIALGGPCRVTIGDLKKVLRFA
jgi:hypothetical protein